MTNFLRARLLLRVCVAGLLAAHGWYRFLTGGYVGFGEWLTSQHIPLAPMVAMGVTAFEILGTPVLAAGRYVRWLTPVFACIYASGALLVHRPDGWFVVGGGRNGMEYSVLILCALATLWLMHPPEARAE